MLLPVNEQKILNSGFDTVVGIDEAGRGAWAGPVSIGYFTYQIGDPEFEHIKDSKLLSAGKRQQVYSHIRTQGGVIFKSPEDIDQRGITVVIEEAIAEIMALYQQAYFLIDGRFKAVFPKAHEFIIKGDQTHYSIAAASILAKQSRDLQMIKYDETYPDYKFSQHKGYGTKVHKECIDSIGPTPIHRFSFRPIKSA